MQEVRLSIRKRAFPSEGRVRLNIAHLPALGADDGDRVDLINEAAGRTVTVILIADTMVREGQIRVSAEDLAKIGLDDEADVLVVRTSPLREKVKKAAAGANAALSNHAASLDAAVSKTAGEVKTEAGKAAAGLKKEAKNASQSIGRAAKSTAREVKKAVRKARGDDSL